jgi:hypothetical protein
VNRQTPQEKKRLSYERDRRNCYGESPHAARKSIPLRKALRNRANRHYQNQPLKQLAGHAPDTESCDSAESQVYHRAPNDWRKHPDAPLGEIVAGKVERREMMRIQGGRRALIMIRYPSERQD